MHKNSRKKRREPAPFDPSQARYAGIDYHKQTMTICIGDENGEILLVETISSDEKAVVDFFGKFRGLICVVETCRGYEWLVELLRSRLGFTVYVCDAGATKAFLRRTRSKSDRVDSTSLMELLAKDFLPVCYQPTREERGLRDLVRWRCRLVKMQTQTKLRIHAMLDKENRGRSRKDLFNKKGMEYLRTVRLDALYGREIMDDNLTMLDEIGIKLERLNKKIEALAEESSDAQLLMTIPGVGALSAILLLAEIGDVTRFSKANQVVKYVGLCPSTYQSSDRRTTGGITKQGSPLVRWILIQDAWIAIRTSIEMRRRYADLVKRCGKKKAAVAIARRILEIAFHVLREKKPYDSRLQGSKGS